jgi:hypothetical protein
MANILPGIAKSFSRLGWLGVWIQAVLAILPVAMLIYVLFGRATGSRLTFGFVNYLAFAGLGILAFTTLWSYRYTRLARRIADPDKCPSWTAVTRTLWIGLWASCLGLIVSVAMLLIEVVRLLALLLRAPQGGVPAIQTTTEDRTGWVSSIDIVSLLADLCTLIGELFIIGFTLWLLFKVVRHVDKFPSSGAEAKSEAPPTAGEAAAYARKPHEQ